MVFISSSQIMCEAPETTGFLWLLPVELVPGAQHVGGPLQQGPRSRHLACDLEQPGLVPDHAALPLLGPGNLGEDVELR